VPGNGHKSVAIANRTARRTGGRRDTAYRHRRIDAIRADGSSPRSAKKTRARFLRVEGVISFTMKGTHPPVSFLTGGNGAVRFGGDFTN